MKDQFIWEPSPEFIERTNVRRLMRRLGLATYQDFVRYSQEHLEEFWDEIALEVGIDWYQAYDQVLDTSKGNLLFASPSISVFMPGRAGS